MKTSKIIKEFSFEERYRKDITFGTGVRMDSRDMELLLVYSGGYSTDDDLYAITPLFSPNSVKKWSGFDVYAQHAYDDAGVPKTSLGFRLHDGTNQYWYNGADWVINTTSWNTEDEIAEHIGEWSAAAKKIKIVINLKTTDYRVTPRLEKIKLLYDSDIKFSEDILARSLIPKLKETLRPISELAISIDAATDEIAIDEYPMDPSYQIIGIDSVFDHTADPAHMTDLFDSYDTGTKTIQLISAIPTGNIAWINFVYEPLVAVSTDEEYSDGETVPAVYITDVNVQSNVETYQADYVRFKFNNTAIKIPSTVQKDLYFSAQITTTLAKDLYRIIDEINVFFSNNRELISRGTDEPYPMIMLSDCSVKSGIDENTLHVAFFRFAVLKALFYQEQDETAFLVVNINVNAQKL
jgi:hypothetical protein